MTFSPNVLTKKNFMLVIFFLEAIISICKIYWGDTFQNQSIIIYRHILLIYASNSNQTYSSPIWFVIHIPCILIIYPHLNKLHHTYLRFSNITNKVTYFFNQRTQHMGKSQVKFSLKNTNPHHLLLKTGNTSIKSILKYISRNVNIVS